MTVHWPRNDRREIPYPHKLEQRRYLVIHGYPEAIVWIDDDNTCRDHHVHEDSGKAWFGLFHLYEDERRVRWAIRCPTTLSRSERDAMLADIPAGSWAKTVATLREIEGEEGKSSRRRVARAVAGIAAVMTRLIT